ncbi:ABC transporter ATP-binding protein [Bacillus sp. BP-3]|uniref:ABC transporter ATP-binding protein n=1 Tax=Bacillus sp. BP-3 TaxID=3022773 RepID=UPI00233116AC|nr:ABC transporter ATP-binding protein [Bacillus sp. BP-3]MDC2864117.1 ABC transporter ATP-binding protein [Bacillus sp. BP-3]
MIEVKNLSYSFKVGKKGKEQSIRVLDNVSFSINKGERIAIVGRSGSGKSTLLHLLSGYITPNMGSVFVQDTDTTNFTEKEWALFRLEHFGFVFQNFQLIPSLTAFENVELPLTLKGIEKKERRDRILELFKKLGLQSYMNHYPNELSGGQQQRVSIARALITEPKIILADEPTGSLDTETEQEILHLIKQLNEEKKITFVMITHDEAVASIANRKLRLIDGRLVDGGVPFEV